jgi:hypothetical protein
LVFHVHAFAAFVARSAECVAEGFGAGGGGCDAEVRA